MNAEGPVAKRQRTLLVAIPCLNEAATIAEVVSAVPRQMAGVDSVDVLVIDDGSSDGTAQIASGAGALVVRHPVNRGVGAAFQSAVDFALENGYDLMVNIDGDRQFDPGDIPKLVQPVVDGRAEMTTASRFIDAAFVPDMPKVKLVGNRMMSALISGLVRKRFADVSCGFRCYARDALLRLSLHGAFTYTQETFLDFAAKRIVIVEVPIRVQYFKDRQSRVAGSIWRYAVNALKIILRGYRDYFPLRFFWGIAVVLAIPALAFGSIFLWHYLSTGKFTGYLYAGFLSAFFLGMAVLFLVVGTVADMLDRIRANQERILLILRRRDTRPRGRAN